jgi:hypothetical protein
MSVQYVAAASQKVTCPMVTGVVPAVTVAVSVTTLPEEIVVTALPAEVVVTTELAAAGSAANSNVANRTCTLPFGR